jgi:acyl carrier protein
VIASVRPAEVEGRLRDFIVEELLEEPFPDGEEPLAAGVVESLGIEPLLDFVDETYGVDLDDDEVLYEHFESLPALTTLIASKLPAEG